MSGSVDFFLMVGVLTLKFVLCNCAKMWGCLKCLCVRMDISSNKLKFYTPLKNHNQSLDQEVLEFKISYTSKTIWEVQSKICFWI